MLNNFKSIATLAHMYIEDYIYFPLATVQADQYRGYTKNTTRLITCSGFSNASVNCRRELSRSSRESSLSTPSKPSLVCREIFRVRASSFDDLVLDPMITDV